MKKLLSICLTLALMLSLSACGADNSAPSEGDTHSSSEISSSSEVSSQESGSSSSSSPSGINSSSSSTPAQTSSSSSQAPVTKLTWWQDGLSMSKLMPDYENPSCGEISYFYIYDDSKKLSYPLINNPFCSRGVNDLTISPADLLIAGTESEDIGERIMPDYFCEIVALDDTKFTITFYEDGVELVRSLPRSGIEGVKLALDKSVYNDIKENLMKNIDNATRAYPAWLTMMRRSRFTDIEFTSVDKQHTDKIAIGSDVTQSIVYYYEDIALIPVENMRETTQRELPNSAKATINFNNGLKYEIFLNDEQLLVYASDLDTALIYDLIMPSINMLDDYAQGKVNPRTGKPVIYLYPTQPTECTVTVDYPRFTYTYPRYNDGWHITAYPDGRLINKADNTEHYYLFWEGNRRIAWDFSEGFVVKGSETESFLREKLAYMGLTPREYNDFITYWVPQMQNASYNLITFAAEQYEQLAPLTVTPTPDSVLRVHMVFRSIDEPIEIPEQQLSTFERRGFTVVEWGGTNDN